MDLGPQAEGRVVGEEVDLFAESELSWSFGEDFYVLSGGDQGKVVIRKDENGSWSVTVIPRRGGHRGTG